MYNAVCQVLMIPWPHYIMGRNYYRVYDTKTFGSDMVELPGFRQKKCVRESHGQDHRSRKTVENGLTKLEL